MKFQNINFSIKLVFKFYQTALMCAVDIGNVEIIKLLLENNKIDVNIINIFKWHFF